MRKLGLFLLGTSILTGKVYSAEIEKVYSIQLGAFSKKENAERFIKKLPPDIKRKAFIYINERGFYSVRIGKAKSQKDLIEIKKNLKKYRIKGFISKTIVAKKEKPKAVPVKTTKKEIRKAVKTAKNQSIKESFYSIQLGAFSTEYNAEKFIKTLPENLQKEAFIYKNKKGFYTVRVGKAKKVSSLKKLKSLLKGAGLHGFIAKTEIEKIKAPEPELEKETKSIKGKTALTSGEKIVSTEKRAKPKKANLVYSILVAITKDKNVAESIKKDYSQKYNIKTFIKEKKNKNSVEYYIYLGEFATEEEAREFMVKNLKGFFVIEPVELPAYQEEPEEVEEIKEIGEPIETITGKTPIYSILVLETMDRDKAIKKKESLEKKFGKKAYIEEEIIGFNKKVYKVYFGDFTDENEAIQFLNSQIPEDAKGVSEIAVCNIEAQKIYDQNVVIKEEGVNSLEPAVENSLSPEGTPENRRVEINVFPFGKSEKDIDISKYISKGMYILNIWLPKTHYLKTIKNVEILFKPPKGFNYIVNTASLNGKPVHIEKKDGFYIAKYPQIKGDEELDFKLQFMAKEKLSLNNMPVFIVGEDRKGHIVKIYGFDIYKEYVKEVEKIYKQDIENKTLEENINQKVKYGISYPSEDITQTYETTNIVINVPTDKPYRVYLNNREISNKKIGEINEDKEKNLKTVKYVNVKLQKGTNEILLKVGEKKYSRKITVSDEVSNIRIRTFPEKPEADGKTPAYITVELLDKDGVPIKNTTFIEVYADKGDIWDETTGQWIKFGEEPIKVKAYSGKAVIKLSPASSTEERHLKIFFGEIERDYTVRFYPEKRPWIVVGNLEGGIGIGDTKNNPDQTKMPFKHKDGTRLEGKASVFAKGSINDYTITARYQTEKPDDVLMNQNIPSTEENQFYPVYGDDSEQYFEARSKNRLFLKVEKDLSYFMFGDYRTNLGSDLEFNRYNRTFNGIDVNLQKEKNYRIQGFITKNSQEQLKEEFQGKGISGPYFLKNPVREYSERIWIETRDRYNPNIVLNRKELHRFTDYTINYEEGFIIFHEPVKQFDDRLNPNYVVVVYETDSLQEEKYTYGLRGEKQFFDGKLRFGLTGIKEEHVLKDKKLYGADVLLDTGKLRILGELSRTETDNDGFAGKLEGKYTFNQYFAVGGYYKKVQGGYQNLSAITADQGYETYSANISARSKDGKIKAVLEGIVENRDIDRKTGNLIVDYRPNKKLSFTVGGRIHRENTTSGTDTRAVAVAGFTYRPNEKLSLSLRREQAFKKDISSSYYPTRTIGRIDYRVSKWFNSYLQSEYQERADKDVSLTTFGLEGRLKENTTAFSKYTLDDSASGWRTQSHIGLNHLFRFTDKFTGDVSVENVHTFSGDKDGDYTALSLRGAYIQTQRYKLSAGYEIRFGDFQPNHLLTLGGITKIGKAGTLLLRERYFKNQKTQNDLLLGFAYRPVSTDVWNSLFKLRWKNAKGELYNNKYIGSLHLNIQPNSKLRTSWEYAFKYTAGGSIGKAFVDLYRGRFSYDITDRVDIGAHGGILWDHKNKNYSYAYGPEIGYTLFRNFWVSLGYNVQGFHDSDFEEANYWAKGAYLKFRLKFDEDLFKRLLND